MFLAVLRERLHWLHTKKMGEPNAGRWPRAVTSPTSSRLLGVFFYDQNGKIELKIINQFHVWLDLWSLNKKLTGAFYAGNFRK